MSVATAAPAERTVPVEPATPEALAPFGQIFGRHAHNEPIGVAFYGNAVATSRPVQYRCDGPTELSLSTLSPRAGRLRYIERHFQHTQTFIPMGGKPFVLVMAPPGAADMPDLDAMRGFYFDGSAGFMMHIGTWHEFPFPLEPDTDLAVVLSSPTTADLSNTSSDGNEASGPDLQKIDIVRRAGVELTVDLDAWKDGERAAE